VAGKSNVTLRISSFSVSSDGNRLAYTLSESPFIFEVQISGGQQHKITPPMGLWFRLPRWSPSADRLAFIAEFRPAPEVLPINGGLWTCKADGTDLRRVVRADSALYQGITFADWHPNGSELVYAFTGPGGAALPHWLTVPAKGGTSRYLPLSGTLYDIAADGSWLLGEGFTPVPPKGRHEFSDNVLMRIPIDGKSPTVLTPACRSDIEGRISPDGSRVVAVSWPSVAPACPRVSGAVKYGLWVMNSDGTGRVALDVKNTIGREFPQWSADGHSVYYPVTGAKGPEIWRADPSGATPPQALPGTAGADRFRVVR
jgi:Tol biopolymer transport system component